MHSNITPRREKRAAKDAEKLKVMRLHRELQKLQDQQWKAPYIELEKPIRNGWKKTFVLRADVARRTDANIFADILKVVNTTVYCRKADFLVRRSVVSTYLTRHKNVKKKYTMEWVPIPHNLSIIGKNTWEKLEPTWTVRHKKYFTAFSGLWSCPHHKWVANCGCRQCTLPSFYFDTLIEPNFITHIRPIDPELESKIQRLRNYIDTHKLWPKIERWVYGKSYYDDWYDSPDPNISSLSQLEEWQREGWEEPFDNPTYEFKKINR